MTIMTMKLLGISLAIVMLSGSIPLGFSEPLRVQLEQGIETNQIQCDNPNHVLVYRTNGNPACVSERSAERMGWEIYVHPLSINKILEEFPADCPVEWADCVELSDETLEEFVTPITEELLDDESNEIYSQNILQMPPKDPDNFAERMAEFYDDKIVNTIYTEDVSRYETEKGFIRIQNEPVEEFGFKYIFIPAISTSQQTNLMPELLEELGITLDGTEFYRSDLFGRDDINPQYYQRYDNVFVLSNQILIVNDGRHTSISFNNWDNNLAELDLIPYQDVEQKSKDYILTQDELTGPNCDIGSFDYVFDDVERTYNKLVILDGKPIWKIVAGECQYVNHLVGAMAYAVYVDAVSGEILDYKIAWRNQ